jgi:hypothetical protein
MTKLIKQWRTSGRPATSFADAHGITRAKFEYWKTRLGVPRRRRTRRPSAGFVPVRLVEPTGGDHSMCEVLLASGDRLVIRGAMPLELVRGVLEALRAQC